MTATPAGRDALAPLREALLEAAHRAAAQVVAAADADADAVVAQAQEEAASIRAQARERGAADAEALLSAERASARREARGVVLAEQRRAMEDLRAAAREAVRGLRADPGFPAMRAALAERARAELGGSAVVRDADGGGVVATAGTRRLAFTLDDLADEQLDRLGPAVAELWRP